ncbi:MCE family protein [Actinocorallia longicatena]|uniref:MCE family protein n=1 Tax=Actinocorallia longicatena TaxID=111803 RepID=A0ABP6QES5_9ACTN
MLGVSFLLACVLLVVLCIAFYNRAFSDTVKIKYTADRAGLQLLEHSDVKIRGLIVGEVRSIEQAPEGAVMELAIQKDKAKFIPSNATGRLLPKTLFGEKYIDLSAPAQPAAPIKNGSVLTQDKTAVSVEIDQVLNDIMPLLKAVEPAKLNQTLNAVATALDGRGEKLGRTAEQLDSLLAKVNPKLKTFLYDLKAAGDVSDVYSAATPDLMRALRNINVTSTTIVDKQAAIEELIPAVTRVADHGTRFMNQNSPKIVGLNISLRSPMSVLARYSPSFPCVMTGLDKLSKNNNEAVGGGKRPSSNLWIEIVKPRPGYKYPLDVPEAKDFRNPRCYGLPNPKVPFDDWLALDGTEDDIWWKKNRSMSSLFVTPGAGQTENDVVKAVVAPTLNMEAADVPDFVTLLFGPLANGTVVNVQ